MKSIFELFFTFFKLGLFTFGGGYAMIPGIKEIVIEKKKWMSEDEVLELIAIAEATPGPIAINMATFIGYKQKKFLGSVMATLGVVLPSFIIIYVISIFFREFLTYKYVAFAFIGIKAAVSFLILKAGIGMIIKMKKSIFNIIILSLVIISLIVLELLQKNISSIILILIGAILGLVVFLIKQKKEGCPK